MGARLQQWQKGFELGDAMYRKVLKHKSVFCVSVLAACAEMIRYFTMGDFLRELMTGAWNDCRFCLFINYIVTILAFIVFYFVLLGIVFYVRRVAKNENAKLFVGFAKSLQRLKNPLFWFVVLFPLGGLFLLFVATSVLPVLVGRRLRLLQSLKKVFYILKNNFFVMLGFFVSIGILYFVVTALAEGVRFLLQLSRVASLELLGSVISVGVTFGMLTFVMAIWLFFLVELIDIESRRSV